MIKTISKDVTELMDFMTKKDCKELKELIILHPEAPLLIFAGEEAYGGEYAYESVDGSDISVKELTIYGDQWLDKSDYEEILWEDMSDDEQCENLSDDEFKEEFDKIVAETAFVKAIVVYVG